MISAANPVTASSPAIMPAEAATAPMDIAKQLRLIVHELNNPLAVMMGFTQLILLDDRSEGKVREDLDKVYAEMKRVARVVERLHTFALSLQAGAGAASRTGPGDPGSLPPGA